MNRWAQLALALTVCLAGSAFAQSKDVTFFVIGKHANFAQSAEGELDPVDFSFFSEIFFTADGNATNASLTLPTGEQIAFADQRLAEGPEHDNLLLVQGEARYSSYAALQARYPDGAYQIQFNTPSGSVTNSTLKFPHDGLPNAPRITLLQHGRAAAGVVDPDHPLEVHWSSFSQGGADENGIIDDLVFVILEDDTGQRVAHSGRPFEGKPYLTYADQSHTIAASALQAGSHYTLSVEHAVLSDTRRFDGVPAMTTYAVTTNLAMQTKPEEGAAMTPSTDAQVVMFYYADLAAADRFYGQTLGLSKTLDEDWVKFYQTSANGSVGLVAEGEGAWHQVQPSNAVMLSIVTSEIDAWYQLLRAKPDVKFLKPIGDGGPIRSFLIEDPGGYTVEFFQWRQSVE